MDIPESWGLDGYPETRRQSTLATLTAPLHMRDICLDEQDFFQRVLGHPTGPGSGRWWTNGFDETVGHRVALLLRGRRGTRGSTFRRFVHECIGPALRAAAAQDLRTYTFLPYSRFLYPTPGVAHDNPPPHRYHATVIFGTHSRAAVDDLLATSQIASLISQQHTVLAAVHAYSIERSVPVIHINA
jgi:hypothetical protein